MSLQTHIVSVCQQVSTWTHLHGRKMTLSTMLCCQQVFTIYINKLWCQQVPGQQVSTGTCFQYKNRTPSTCQEVSVNRSLQEQISKKGRCRCQQRCDASKSPQTCLYQQLCRACTTCCAGSANRLCRLCKPVVQSLLTGCAAPLLWSIL